MMINFISFTGLLLVIIHIEMILLIRYTISFSVYQLCSLSYKPMKMSEDVETDAILRYSTYLDVLCFDWRIASICFGENYDRSKITNKNLFVN